jgi:Xaa-Pro aminopeptidase
MHRRMETGSVNAPFDTARLDALMGEADIDVLLASSPHNVRYLLGGYRFFFFHTFDAFGVSRYLPILVYLRGRPEDSLYVAQVMEGSAQKRGAFWTPYCTPETWGSADAMAIAVDHLKKIGVSLRRIGIEAAFLPADAKDVLASAFQDAAIVDALRPLERLRAIKKPHELALLRKVSEGVADSLVAAFTQARVGMTKHQWVSRVRQEQIQRDVEFNCCQIAFGSSLDRAPSGDVLGAGEIVSLDAVGGVEGYVGDLCRMGIAGAPDAELDDLLAEVNAVQRAARAAVRAGVSGGAVVAAGDAAVTASPHRTTMDFTVHGMGLILHEAPRLAHGRPIPYRAEDADLPLEAGMVLSIETAIRHSRRGFIKLEDTIAVKPDGGEAFSDYGRGWNVIGG